MIKRFCDKCGKEILITEKIDISIDLPYYLEDKQLKNSYEICEKCYLKLVDFMEKNND